MHRRIAVIVTVALAAALVPSGCSREQGRPRRGAFPSRPIKLVVPFKAGGGTDAFARIVNKAIRDESLLPQPMVIINAGGAGATIGSRRVKNSRPDGYTLLILHDAILTAKANGNVGYGPEAFEPIAGTGEVGMVIVVRDNSPYRSLKQLMEAARRDPGTITFGANIGALTHFAGLMLEEKCPGAAFRYVQLGGGAERFSKLIGEHIDVTGFSLEEFERFRSQGLRGLAVLSNDPYRLGGGTVANDTPEKEIVPTAVGQGYDVAMTNTFYWWAPKGTPPDRVRRIADALKKAMQSDGVRQWARDNQCNPIFLRGKDLSDRISASAVRYGRVTPAAQSELPNYPRVLLVAMAFIGIWIVFGRYRNRYVAPPTDGNTESNATPRVRTAVWCAAVTLLYYVALGSLQVDFRLATFAYVAALGGILVGFRSRSLLALTVIAGLMSFGLEFVLSAVFDVHFS